MADAAKAEPAVVAATKETAKEARERDTREREASRVKELEGEVHQLKLDKEALRRRYAEAMKAQLREVAELRAQLDEKEKQVQLATLQVKSQLRFARPKVLDPLGAGAGASPGGGDVAPPLPARGPVGRGSVIKDSPPELGPTRRGFAPRPEPMLQPSPMMQPHMLNKSSMSPGGLRPAPASAGVRRSTDLLRPPRTGQGVEAVNFNRNIGGPIAALDKRYTVEEQIQRAVRSRTTIYEGEKGLLTRLLREAAGAVSGGNKGHGADAYALSAAAKMLGLDVSPQIASGVMWRIGIRDAVVDYESMGSAVMQKALVKELSTTELVAGPLKPSELPLALSGPIKYPQCRSGVYAPHDFDMGLVARSKSEPDAWLKLKFIYGYSGLTNTAPNVFFTDNGDVAYYTAGVGIVYNKASHTQKFFLGHDNDIVCMAVLTPAVKYLGAAKPREAGVSEGDADREVFEWPARTLFATGQMKQGETDVSGHTFPYVCVWDSRTCTEVVKINLEKDDRQALAVGFSADGKKLVIVAADNNHTVYVYDWFKKALLASGKGCAGVPPQVYGVVWDPHAPPPPEAGPGARPERFVTHGARHAKLWTVSPESGSISSSSITVGKVGMSHMPDITCVVFMPPHKAEDPYGCILLGCPKGDILIVKAGSTAVTSMLSGAHKPGPVITLDNGHSETSGVRVMRLLDDQKTLFSAGGDGVVRRWEVAQGLLTGKAAGKEIRLNTPYKNEAMPVIRGLDTRKGSNWFVFGTSKCDIWEGDDTPEPLIYGHNGNVTAVAWHPKKKSVFASAAQSERVYVWDADTRHMLRTGPLTFDAFSCAFSSEPVDGQHHLAVGGLSGDLVVMKEDNLQPVLTAKPCNFTVSDLKYSPDNKWLAASSHDLLIHLFNVRKKYEPTFKLNGHVSSVLHCDWSSDSTVLVSTCSSYEVLFWNPKTGKQLKNDEDYRNHEWASWTCPMGFSVMGIFGASTAMSINAVARSKSGKFVTSVGHDGLVKLFNYPCVAENPESKDYLGHSSHVMCVRFSDDDRYVTSAGGHDRAVFQFTTHKIAEGAGDEEEEPVRKFKPKAIEKVWGPLSADGKTWGWVDPKKAAALAALARNPTLAPKILAAKEEGGTLGKEAPVVAPIVGLHSHRDTDETPVSAAAPPAEAEAEAQAEAEAETTVAEPPAADDGGNMGGGEPPAE